VVLGAGIVEGETGEEAWVDATLDVVDESAVPAPPDEDVQAAQLATSPAPTTSRTRRCFDRRCFDGPVRPWLAP
jgi:hypothetical protein